MIRVCLKCNAFYADAGLAFCLTDGTPLVNLDPSSEHWSEGVRAIEEKEDRLRKHKRKLKWRRVVTSMATIVMLTMVIWVMVDNSLVYVESSSPSPPPSPSPILSPSPSPTPTPTPPECSETDKRIERKVIVDKFGDIWRGKATQFRPKVNDEVTPGGVTKLSQVSLKKVDIKRVVNTCTSASINVTYVWEVKPVQTNPHITPEARKVETKTRFNYVKVGDAWRSK